MPYPLIILGAGASFDSLEDHSQFGAREAELDNWKPPLTNEIFDRARFSLILDKNPEAKYLDGETYRIKKDFSLEDLMNDILNNEAPSYPVWYRRIMSFRFYLQELFSEATKKYFDKRNNYNRLLSEIRRNAGNRACFVNFNYDLLLERNIFDVENMTDVDDYMSGNIKVLKIHGACNWFRSIGRGYKTDRDFKNGKDYSIENAQTIFQSENGNGIIDINLSRPTIKNIPSNWEFYEPVPHGSGFSDDEVKYFVPDIALPIHKKRDFVCPVPHIEIFKKEFQKTDRVIIIGWKATDESLLNILKEYLGNRPVIVVSHNSSNEIAERISNLKSAHGFRAAPINQGFSEFLKSGKCAEVLSEENPDIMIQKLKK